MTTDKTIQKHFATLRKQADDLRHILLNRALQGDEKAQRISRQASRRYQRRKWMERALNAPKTKTIIAAKPKERKRAG